MENLKRSTDTRPYLIVIGLLLVALIICIVFLGMKDSPQSSPPLPQQPPANPVNTALPTQPVQQQKPTTTKTEPVQPQMPNQPAAPDKQEQPVAAEEAELSPQKTETLDSNSLIGRFANAIAGYYAATTPEEKAKFVIDGQDLLSTMKQYYKDHPIEKRIVKTLSPPKSLPVHGKAYWQSTVSFDDGSKGFVAMLVVDDKPLIDWESEVRYSTLDWNKWLESKSKETGDFRVYAAIEEEKHSLKPLDAKKEYVILQLTNDLQSGKKVQAYLDLSTFDNRELFRTISKSKLIECVLTLKQVEVPEAKYPVVSIEKVVSNTWVIPREN